MKLKSLKNSWNLRLKIIVILMFLLFGNGCIRLGKKYVTLVSKDLTWTIPKNTEFWATQSPNFEELTKFIVEEDLSVLYKGKLLELEQEANTRAIKSSRVSRKQKTMISVIGSIFTFLTGLFAYIKKKKGKEKA